MADVVIPYRKPPHGDHELRFALRSIAETVNPERVFLLGDCPDWVTGVEHVPGADMPYSRILNVQGKLRRFCRHKDRPEDFLLWNDDMYWLDPGSPLPIFGEESIGELAARLSGEFRVAAENTIDIVGASKHWHAELHAPLMVNTKYLWCAVTRDEGKVMYRTLATRPYIGDRLRELQLHSLNLAPTADRLARDPDDVPALMQGPWFSTRDDVSCDPVFTKAMTARFPEPCRFEKG